MKYIGGLLVIVLYYIVSMAVEDGVLNSLKKYHKLNFFLTLGRCIVVLDLKVLIRSSY